MSRPVVTEAELEAMQLERAMKESVAMAENKKKTTELQFLDDVKRAILVGGGHCTDLGPLPVHEQVTINSDPSQKILRKKQTDMPDRLKLMRSLIAGDDDGGDGNDDAQMATAIRESMRTAQVESVARTDVYSVSGGGASKPVPVMSFQSAQPHSQPHMQQQQLGIPTQSRQQPSSQPIRQEYYLGGEPGTRVPGSRDAFFA